MAAELTAVLSADSSKLQKALGDAKSVLKQYKDEANRTVNVSNAQVQAFDKAVNSMARLTNGGKNAKAEINGLRNQIQNLTAQYTNLSDEVKRSDFGKAMAASINEAATKLKTLKENSDKVKESIGETTKESGGFNDMLDKLSSTIGVNIGSLGKMTSVLGLGAVAYKGLEEVLQHNEAAVDEWGRTVEVSQSLYENFCRALNNSDLSSFFKQIDNIVEHAQKAYNAIDDLATKGGIISNAEKRYNAQRAKYQKILKDPNATDKEKKTAEQQLKEIGKLRTEYVKQTKELNNNAIKEKLREIFGNLSDENYKKYYSLIVKSLYDTKAADKLSNTYVSQGKKIVGAGKNAKVVDNKINLGNILTDEKRGELKPYIGAYWDAETRLHQDERADNRIIGGGGSKSKSSSTGSPKVNNKTNDLMSNTIDKINGNAISSLWELNNTLPELEPIKREVQLYYDEDGNIYNPLKEAEKIFGDMKLPKPVDEWDKDIEQIERYAKGINMIGQETNATAEALEYGSNQLMNISNALSIAAGSSKEIQSAAIVGQAIATIALSFAKALESCKTWYEWLAFGISGVGTMVSMISQVKSVTSGYAQGGIIKGNNTVGDYNLARVNSGEMILNGTQQERLWRVINGNTSVFNSVSNGKVEFEIKGKKLVGVQSNYYRQQNKL